MSCGYMGKILWVDLTLGEVREEKIEKGIYERYLTGVGLAARMLYDRIPAGADPLGPENVLAFTSGILCGTGAFFMGRWMVAGKSPLTGGWGDANCGGTLGPAIKRCGYDAIFFAGISPGPVYLRVVHRKADLVDASHLWGMDALEAETQIQKEVADPRTRVAVIGPAGEKLSLIAGVVNARGRLAARSGLGAVMGSKKLKGVALAGRDPIRAHDPGRVAAASRKLVEFLDRSQVAKGAFSGKGLNLMGRMLRRSPVALGMTGDMANIVMSKFGSIATNVLSSETGDSPVKNWKGVGFTDFPIATHADRLNPQKIVDFEQTKYHCYSCPVGCGGVLKVDRGKHKLEETHKPEYETCCAFGALILNNDLDTVFYLNDLLNRAGMDTISAGATVAFAIECLEQNGIGRSDVDGLDLHWGNSEAVIEFVKKMISREGCGDLFADGCKKAAQRIGKGSGKIAMHAGGQELPMHDSRFDPGFAVSYALEPTPGRHTNHGYQWLDLFALHRLFKGLPSPPAISAVKSKYDPKGKWILQVAASKYMQLVNAVGGCLFGVQMGGNLPIPTYLNAALGWSHEPEHYLKIGERIQNLRQAFNFKHGVVVRRDFALPERAWGKPPLEKGPMKGVTLPIDRLYADFLAGMGWTAEEAKPTRKKLEELELTEVIEDLYPK
ncbi:MAG: aldehyde ferredoxin oxidoreductase family protein [bacterium]